jgi:hypothetical protein
MHSTDDEVFLKFKVEFFKKIKKFIKNKLKEIQQIF